MENLITLNNKKVKKVIQTLNDQFGFSGDLKKYAVFYKKKDSSLKIITRDVDEVLDKKLNIDSLGLKIGKEISDGILLTIEGAQLLGPKCNKNIIEVTDEERRLWLKGYDLERDKTPGGFVLLKKDKDYLGSAKVKEGRIINNVPKPRRIRSRD